VGRSYKHRANFYFHPNRVTRRNVVPGAMNKNRGKNICPQGAGTAVNTGLIFVSIPSRNEAKRRAGRDEQKWR